MSCCMNGQPWEYLDKQCVEQCLAVRLDACRTPKLAVRQDLHTAPAQGVCCMLSVKAQLKEPFASNECDKMQSV